MWRRPPRSLCHLSSPRPEWLDESRIVGLMNEGSAPEGVQGVNNNIQHQQQASVQPEAAAQWAQNVAGMQALYKQTGPGGAPFLPPNQLAAYYANAAQFTPLLYNAHMMNGLGGIPHPYAFMQGSMPQAQQLSGAQQPPSQPRQAAGGSQSTPTQQEGGSKKRQRYDKPAGESKAQQSDPSDSQSPQSERGSEQYPAEFDAAAGNGDGEAQGGQHLGASNSVQNLLTGGSMELQDEREVKKLRRKQSNRESARRSRLRKQAECEALSGKVVELQQENLQLKEANRALLSRVEELVTRLEQVQRAAANVGKTAAGESAFAPVVPVSPPAGKSPPTIADGSVRPQSDPSQPSTQTIESEFAGLQHQRAPPEAAIASN